MADAWEQAPAVAAELTRWPRARILIVAGSPQVPLHFDFKFRCEYAALEMVEHSIHRLLVVEQGRLIGVISTLDLAAAVRDARIETPISAWMTATVVTLDGRQPVVAAIDLLDRLHITSLVVSYSGWPIGMFSQIEALIAGDLPRDTPVESVLDTAMMCLPSSLPVFRAAAHAAQLDVRRVIASDGSVIAGILGGLDFARVVAG